jgi:hypothetical protein
MTHEELIEQEKEFLDLATGVLDEAKKRGVTLRLLGAIAFRWHCPEHKSMQYSLGRKLTDIDFASLSREAPQVQRLFHDLGCSENEMVMRLFGSERRIFYYPDSEIHSDVFFDRLKFCHDIELSRRLAIDYPTIPIADLLLEKLQIVEINEKDLIDSAMLLREHPVSDSESETINAEYISDLCSKDWGMWRTITGNLERLTGSMPRLIDDETHRETVVNRISSLMTSIDSKPKTFAWKMRAKIGDKKKWYRDVEELERD